MKALTAGIGRPMTWVEQAACLSERSDLFFPVSGSGPAEHVAMAKAVCARCPVRGQCLAFALESRQEFGIWGGLTEDERRRMLRNTRRRSRARRAGAEDPDRGPAGRPAARRRRAEAR